MFMTKTLKVTVTVPSQTDIDKVKMNTFVENYYRTNISSLSPLVTINKKTLDAIREDQALVKNQTLPAYTAEFVLEIVAPTVEIAQKAVLSALPLSLNKKRKVAASSFQVVSVQLV